MPALSSISETVKAAAAEAGFELAGVAAVRDFPELDYFAKWVEAGYAGEMRYLESRSESGQLKRASLRSAAPWARSVVVCAINYNTEEEAATVGGSSGEDQPTVDGLRSTAEQSAPADEHSRARDRVPAVTAQEAFGHRPSTAGSRLTGWISRYAWSVEDYHEAVLRRLRAVEAKLREAAGTKIETRCYVDTGPLVERVYAKYAGIGWIGKNTCVINQRLGSWLFLGVILTSLELQPDLPAPDRCGTCMRCIDACPTDAFVGPYELDATRCISYLTIEKRGEIPVELRPGVGRHVFGCDICQDVCPWNRRAPASAAPEFQPRPGLVNPALEWLAQMDSERFREIFRGSPLKRAKLSGLRRNAVVAMGNSGERSFLPVLRGLAEDPDPVLAEHARWAIAQLHSESAGAADRPIEDHPSPLTNEKPSQQHWEGTGSRFSRGANWPE